MWSSREIDSHVSESFTIKSSAYNFLKATRCPRSFQNLFYNSSPVLFLKQEVEFCQRQINSNIQLPAPNSRLWAHLWFLQNTSLQLYKAFDWKKTKVIKVCKSIYVHYDSQGCVYRKIESWNVSGVFLKPLHIGENAFGSYFSRYVWILSQVLSNKTFYLCFSLIFLTITLSLKHFSKLRNIVCPAEGTEASAVVSCLYQDEVPFPLINAIDTILGTGKLQKVTSVHTLTS